MRFHLEPTSLFYLVRIYKVLDFSDLEQVEMDLDTIQDLLGGSNLPPPPSVQDLLGDVIPIPRSPSPPSPLPSLQLSAEHNYSRGLTDCVEDAAVPMESSACSPGSQTLASLNSSLDCYEAFLLNLLRVYTQNRIDSGATSTDQPDPTGSGSELYTIDDISPEAITTLSQGQVQSLVTSNSTYYDVIHQVLAYRQRSGSGDVDGTMGEKGVVGESVQGTGIEKPSNETMSALQQLQALQLTPEQLKQIQLQMAELIRTKQIILPTELSVDQQHQLLQSLILKQVHSQHQHLTTPTTASPTTPQPSTASSSTVTSSTTTTSSAGSSGKSVVGGTLATMLRKDVEKNEAVGGDGRGKTVKMEVPPASNLSVPGRDTNTVPLELSPNPVADDSSATTGGTAIQPVTTRGGGRKKKDTKDEDEPKKPSSSYGIFFSDVYPSVLQANPRMSFSEASKLISAMWNAMGGDTKKQYHERCEKQKEVYQAFISSRKSENKPMDTSAAHQTPSADTQTVGHATLTTKQTVQVEMTVTEPVVGLSDALTSNQDQKPSPPLPTHPRVVVKDVKHCVNEGCFKDTVYTEYRGPRYCSNECVVQHCRSVFQEWVTQRKVAT